MSNLGWTHFKKWAKIAQAHKNKMIVTWKQ